MKVEIARLISLISLLLLNSDRMQRLKTTETALQDGYMTQHRLPVQPRMG